MKESRLGMTPAPRDIRWKAPCKQDHVGTGSTMRLRTWKFIIRETKFRQVEEGSSEGSTSVAGGAIEGTMGKN
jgi:hypothetical protein